MFYQHLFLDLKYFQMDIISPTRKESSSLKGNLAMRSYGIWNIEFFALDLGKSQKKDMW